MLQFIDSPDDVIAVTISDKISGNDLDRIMDRLDQILETPGKVHVFVESVRTAGSSPYLVNGFLSSPQEAPQSPSRVPVAAGDFDEKHPRRNEAQREHPGESAQDFRSEAEQGQRKGRCRQAEHEDRAE